MNILAQWFPNVVHDDARAEASHIIADARSRAESDAAQITATAQRSIESQQQFPVLYLLFHFLNITFRQIIIHDLPLPFPKNVSISFYWYSRYCHPPFSWYTAPGARLSYWMCLM